MSKMQENVFEAMKTSPKRQYDLEERTLYSLKTYEYLRSG